jgi:DNA polymerase III subunit gamma/tau
MSQYLVSARKYRPQTFDTVVGQEHITTTLKNAIRTNHLAHAFLFCGPRGVGKTTCARILAKTINCENLSADTEACGECNSCKAFSENTSFNIFELDAASNNSVDDIRELVNGVRFAPQQGRYKIYIIDEVHMLSASAFNAFLKTLEEPPPYAIFILATTEKHKILPTILSRCQIFDFKRITTADTVAHLHQIATKEGLVAEEAALHVISQKSEGCMRDSLSMLDRIASFTGGSISYSATMEHLAMLDADFYFNLTDTMLAQDVSSALLQLDRVLEKGFEGNVVLQGLAEHFRNLLLCKDARMAKLLDVPNEHRKQYFDKAAQAPPSFILSALNVLNDSELHYKEATNKRLHTELCLIRLCYLLQATGAAPVGSEPLKKNSEPNPAISTPAPVYQAPTPQAPPPAAQQPKPAPVEQFTKVEEPAIPKPTPAPPKPAAPVPAPTPQATPTNTDGRRVSSALLKDLDSLLDSIDDKKEAAKALCQEDADRIFQSFREQAQQGARSVIYAQLLTMQVECIGEDEVRIVSPTAMADSYAQNLRNEFIEYFSKEAGRNVRITNELREDEALLAAQPQVLSKQEMYDEMVKKNPLIAKLREGLNLQIDY